MKKRFWKNFFPEHPGKTFSAWQIELTTRCPLRCRMCCREGQPGLSRKDMSLNDFKKILPYFKHVESVVLEGWGESLLHPDLLECIRLVKREGSRVGFVTSGKPLDRAYIAELVRAETDFIGFSLSGATAASHDSIRINSNLQDLLKHIQGFQAEKARHKCPYPRLHIVYLLLKDNIGEVPALLKLAKDLGIQDVVLIHLILVTNSWQEEQRVFGREGTKEFEKILLEAERMARDWKIQLHRPSTTSRDVAVCSENPLKNLYISVEGEVSPCVYLNPPLPSPFKRLFHGREVQVEKVIFGNLFQESLERIWNIAGYVNFRGGFERRWKKFEGLYSSLWDRDRRKEFENGSLPTPPRPCQTCYKMLGF